MTIGKIRLVLKTDSENRLAGMTVMLSTLFQWLRPWIVIELAINDRTLPMMEDPQ